METTNNTLLNNDSKMMLEGLLAFTESNIPNILSDMKEIQRNEISFNIDELINNKFSPLFNNEVEQGLAEKLDIKNKIKSLFYYLCFRLIFELKNTYISFFYTNLKLKKHL